MLLRSLCLPLSFCIINVLSATPPTPTRTDRNCSHSYTLRVSQQSPSEPGSCTGENAEAAASCVLSSQDDFQQCSSLSRILTYFNGVIQSDDCLQLLLEQGEYVVPFIDTVSVNYTLAMMAPSGGVTITCKSSCQEKANCTRSAPLVFNRKEGNNGEVAVTLEGLRFEDCACPFQFDNLDQVTISNCWFRYILILIVCKYSTHTRTHARTHAHTHTHIPTHTHLIECSHFMASALDLFNIGLLEINHSNFSSCITDVAKAQYRGNSGAVSIAYYTPPDTNKTVITPQPVVHITGCLFWNNSAFLPPQLSSQQINLALNDNSFFGRGGGLGIFIQESAKNVSTFVQNCTFVENFADSFGGGAYLYISGNESHHNFSVVDCNFTGNSAHMGSFGGGIQVAMLIQNRQSPPCNLEFVRCLFDNNMADYGGGLSTVQVRHSCHVSVRVVIITNMIINNLNYCWDLYLKWKISVSHSRSYIRIHVYTLSHSHTHWILLSSVYSHTYMHACFYTSALI